MKKIRMRVGAIMYDKRSGDPIVILNDPENRRALPIWVGVPEARAISMASRKVKTMRPLTHELLNATIERLGYLIKEVTIDEVEEETFIASIFLVNDLLNEVVMDARPSDAIALSMIADAPLYVSQDILSHASLPLVDEDEDADEFREFLADVKASDFNLLEPVQLPDDDSNGGDAA